MDYYFIYAFLVVCMISLFISSYLRIKQDKRTEKMIEDGKCITYVDSKKMKELKKQLDARGL